jgi:hypothetical protein
LPEDSKEPWQKRHEELVEGCIFIQFREVME